jgi:subtilase family serine protease
MIRRSRARLAITILFAVIPVTALAVQKPRPEDQVAPDFDVRAVSAPAAPEPQARAAAERLRTTLPARSTIRFDPFTGLVRRLALPPGAMRRREANARQIARGFLRERADLFGLAERDARRLDLVRAYRSSGDTATHVVFRQRVAGIDVFGGSASVHVAGDAVVWVTSSLITPPDAIADPVVTAAEAVRLAAASIRPDLTIVPRRVAGPAGRDRSGAFARGPFARRIRTRLVLFPMQPQPRLAWRVEIDPPDTMQSYEVLVDAVAGDLLYRRNLVLYAAPHGGSYTSSTGRVVQSDATREADARRLDRYPAGAGPSGPADPPDGCPPMTNYFNRDLVSPFRDRSSLLSNTGHLEGNNVHVYRGVYGTEGATGTAMNGGDDLNTGGGDGWSFDFAFNTADSSETALFYAVNFAHDLFYALGFDEAAGNFQVNNFGRGGLGGDSLRAIARANGRNNANFSTPPDGFSPTMNMFLWDGASCWGEDVNGDGAPDLDGAYDTDIVIHEYHHGVTFRLNQNFTGTEAGAIGEGGGDFFAYSINGDTRLAEYAAPPNGIRSINTKTYGSWFCLFGLFCQPHDNGQIWANTLWALRERFRADEVEGSDEAAVREVHRLYIDGLKLSPPTPTMLDLRDAILQADLLRNPSEDPGGSCNHCRLWSEFAKLGMGVNARDTLDNGLNRVTEDFTVPAECPAPVLPVVTIAATVPEAFEAHTIPGTITVTRTDSTDGPLSVRLATGGTASKSDYQGFDTQVTIPEGATSAAITVTPVNDTLIEVDETLVVTLLSGPGYTVGTPASATVTIVSDDVNSDLTVTALTVPARGGAGAAITIGDTTRNQGSGSSSQTTTGFYLSTNPFFDAADVLLGSRVVPPLPVNGSSTGTTLVTIPVGTPAGTMYVIAAADADSQEGETQEGNNFRFAQILIGPDLAVSALTAPPRAGEGTIISVSDTVTNSGAGSAAPSAVRFYLSTDPLFGSSDVQLAGSRPVAELAPNATSSGAANVTIPPNTATGRYYLIAVADGDGAVPETSETNNIRAAQLLIGPDLAVTALTAPASAAAGGTVAVSDTVRNDGAGVAGPSVVRFYLSANTTLDAADVGLSPARPVTSLGGGATSSGSTTVGIPAGTPAGTYYLFAKADGDGAVVETVETNNTRFAIVRVGPDLTVSALTAPTSADRGASIAVSATVANAGLDPAPGSTLQIYLSVDFNVGTGDVLLTEQPVGPLGPGGTLTVGATITIPATTSAGSYVLIAVADGPNTVAETLETNNTRVRAITVR